MLRDLVDPLWMPIVALAVIWGLLWRAGVLRRWTKVVGTAAIASLWLSSTPLLSALLERPLDVESRIEASWEPTYIYVLSGGYDLGDEPQFDSSGVETVRRVNKAAQLGLTYPDATLMMAGSQPGMEGLRSPEQQGLLMKAQAERLGVPQERIRIESVSLNTKGHAKVAAASGLHALDDPLLIVTSDFHLRRARLEFSRYFKNVRVLGSDPVLTDGDFPGVSLRSILPHSDALSDSARYLREYVAITISGLRD